MKTKGMSHQLYALRLMSDKGWFALFMEQGTGKTWTLLADAERMYAAGTIDSIFVLAPNGVHTNWVKREIPAHLGVTSMLARVWHSGLGARALKDMEELFRPRDHFEIPPLRILSMSYDAANTAKGFDFAYRFLRSTKALIIADESSRIKNPTARRTKSAMKLRSLSVAARISTGTPITNSPPDVFSQMEFLAPGLLGTSSYRAFVAEYADLVPADDPMMLRMIERNPKAAFAQIVAKNPDGTPRWKNLEKLSKLLTPHSYRVLKDECLDLPKKVYKNIYFELTKTQRASYKLMESEFRIQLSGDEMTPVSALNSITKLQQITSGFIILPQAIVGMANAGREASPILSLDEAGPRMKALLEIVESTEGSFIVWARFSEELRRIQEALEGAGISTVRYSGDVSRSGREEAVDAFQSRKARAFVGQPQAGGIGLTLTAASTVIYYSNDYNLETRLQSEDRAHRIGTAKSVLYIDIVGDNTIDEIIASSLQRKEEVMRSILGDRGSRKPEE